MVCPEMPAATSSGKVIYSLFSMKYIPFSGRKVALCSRHCKAGGGTTFFPFLLVLRREKNFFRPMAKIIGSLLGFMEKSTQAQGNFTAN